MNHQGFVAARPTCPAYDAGRKSEIVLSEKIALLLHPHVDVPFRTVWLLRNLSLDGELCLCDDKNAAFLYKFTIYLAIA